MLIRTFVPVKQLFSLSSSIIVIFVITTTHLILKRPVSFVAREERLKVRRSVAEVRGADVSRDTNQAVDYVIFDAVDHKGSLDFLSNPPKGWQVLVVNLHNKSDLLTCKECLMLRDSWVQDNILNKVSEENVFTDHTSPYVVLEKLAAYIYALSRRANWIYSTDRPEPVPYAKLTPVKKYEIRSSVVYQGPEELFEPCGHFMDTFTWRGRRKVENQGRYNVKVVSSHAVHMVVKDCYKSGMDLGKWKDALDLQAPPPYVMPGTFASIDFRNVLVSHLTAWTLVASLTTSIPKSSRSSPGSGHLNIIVQRTMWETDAILGFLPEKPTLEACPSCSVNKTLHSLWKDYREKIIKWHCDTFETVPACLNKFASLSTPTISDGVNVSALVEMWVRLFHLNRFTSSDRISFSKERLHERHVGIPLYFTPAKTMHRITPNISIPQNVFGNFCKADGKWYPAQIPPRHPITDILLIVIFNFPELVSHIPMLEYAYGRHFKHVLYCAESMVEFKKRYIDKFNLNPVSFVEIPHRAGYWGQDCMSAAIKMNYDVTGYLQISDDVIVNVWNLYNLPRHQPWFQSSLRVAQVDRAVVPDIWVNKYWWPWTLFCGQPSAVRVYEYLMRLRSDPDVGERVSNFLENIYSITNCDRCLLYEASDIFYLPSYLSDNYTFFSDIFTRNTVFLEITIPTILAGITSDNQMYRMRGSYLWFQDRDRCPYVYTEHDHFYHAWKLSKFVDANQAKFYCTEFLARVDRDVMSLHEF